MDCARGRSSRDKQVGNKQPESKSAFTNMKFIHEQSSKDIILSGHLPQTMISLVILLLSLKRKSDSSLRTSKRIRNGVQTMKLRCAFMATGLNCQTRFLEEENCLISSTLSIEFLHHCLLLTSPFKDIVWFLYKRNGNQVHKK